MTAAPERNAGRCAVFLTQVYPPDPAAVGQQIADAAAELARRGLRVIVYTADRGYDDPSMRYRRREVRDGVEVRRLPLSSLGKGSVRRRLLGGGLFLAQACLRAVFLRRLDVVVVSTSPPMSQIAGVFLSFVRRAALRWWVMDLNPDQFVALGHASPRALPVRMFEWMNRLALARASDVIVLDRYVAARVGRKAPPGRRLAVVPPWAHEQYIEPVPHDANPFRERHELQGRIVVMHSGNHSTSHPLTTLLEAAHRLRRRKDIVFMFVGGGNARAEIDAVTDDNVRALPYQPLGELRFSLSAADVHVVSMGDDMVGIVHPCKVYGALAAGRPILLFGPDRCHVADILRSADVGWRVGHGDVDTAVRVLESIAGMPRSELEAMGRRARALGLAAYGQSELIRRCCDSLEHGTGAAAAGLEHVDACATFAHTPAERVGAARSGNEPARSRT